MIEFVCIIIVIFVVIKLTSKKIKPPFSKNYTFNIHKNELDSYKNKDKVNVWIKPDTKEIRFYCPSSKDRENELLGTIFNKKIHDYISKNPNNKKASIIFFDEKTITLKLELF